MAAQYALFRSIKLLAKPWAGFSGMEVDASVRQLYRVVSDFLRD